MSYRHKRDSLGRFLPIEKVKYEEELRDKFANSALSAFMRWALDQPHFKDYDSAAKAAAGYARSSYLIADAMLAERIK